MEATLLPSRDTFAQTQLKARLTHTLDQQKLFKAIDDDPALTGAGVVFIDEWGTSVTLRDFERICLFKPTRVILREPPSRLSPAEYVAEVKDSPRESRLVAEAAGAALSCGAAVLGWFVVFTSGAAIPFSGGGSTVFSVMAYGAATASSVQCGNSLMRTRNEVKAPDLNDELDSEEWYQHATLALDVISIGGASAAGLMTIRGIKLLRAEGITTRQALEGLNRQQRRRLSREIARSNAPGVSNKTLKMMERAGKIERRYSNDAIKTTTLRQIKDSIGAGLSFTGSATGGALGKLAVVVVADDE
ncbi:NAD synthetase [Marinobacter bryozoorum]|uniref:NAD synthetase n=1 Tax=Marinobacter bryozoorum TaxID=256324 RepID=UPI002003D7A8|nr:NAD synthetase [Marinobacter bryozoorum]MCK7545403.1 NAD synthetase [Marinobacter bryozoorum]